MNPATHRPPRRGCSRCSSSSPWCWPPVTAAAGGRTSAPTGPPPGRPPTSCAVPRMIGGKDGLLLSTPRRR